MFGSFEESNDAGGAETAGVTTIQSAVNKAELSETRRTSTPQSRGCNSVGAQVSARYPSYAVERRTRRLVPPRTGSRSDPCAPLRRSETGRRSEQARPGGAWRARLRAA